MVVQDKILKTKNKFTEIKTIKQKHLNNLNVKVYKLII